MITVEQLAIYPTKSMQGITLEQINATRSGFENDRIFMVTYPDGRFITARDHPELLSIKMSIDAASEFTLCFPDLRRLSIHLAQFASTAEPTEVWGNHFFSHIAPISINQSLSHYLNCDVQLRWLGRDLTRRIKRFPDVPLSFADGYPYLLLNRASFTYLQQQCPVPLDIAQFRGNIIITGALPFAEDGWKTIKIGDIIFDLVKPCSRCVMTTFDKQTQSPLPDGEPLKTLRYFRQDEQGEIDFGINMIARHSGRVTRQATIEVITRQTAKNYIKQFPPETDQTSQPLTISYPGGHFIGNNRQTLLEQLEINQLSLPNSCQAGICCRCQVTLLKGQIAPLTQSTIRRNNRILACSSIPKTDLTIDFS